MTATAFIKACKTQDYAKIQSLYFSGSVYLDVLHGVWRDALRKGDDRLVDELLKCQAELEPGLWIEMLSYPLSTFKRWMGWFNQYKPGEAFTESVLALEQALLLKDTLSVEHVEVIFDTPSYQESVKSRGLSTYVMSAFTQTLSDPLASRLSVEEEKHLRQKAWSLVTPEGLKRILLNLSHIRLSFEFLKKSQMKEEYPLPSLTDWFPEILASESDFLQEFLSISDKKEAFPGLYNSLGHASTSSEHETLRVKIEKECLSRRTSMDNQSSSIRSRKL